MHTHDLQQYATVHGNKCQKWKRPRKPKKGEYVSPVFKGVERFKTKAEAEAFKAKYDKPIIH